MKIRRMCIGGVADGQVHPIEEYHDHWCIREHLAPHLRAVRMDFDTLMEPDQMCVKYDTYRAFHICGGNSRFVVFV